MLLAPPAASAAAGTWLRLMNAVEDEWPEPGGTLRAPELQTASSEFRDELLAVHDLALWVATLDPYASRDSLTPALGDDVAILHQDRRLGGAYVTNRQSADLLGDPRARRLIEAAYACL